MKKGKLIIIESGTDGSGKATQTQELYGKLISDGKNIKKITFPNYDSGACTPVKMYLNGEFGKDPSKVNPFAASAFYAIDRFASYTNEWGEFYNNGGIIISDRYVSSNMVHQAAKMKNKEERDKYLEWLDDLEFNKFGLPKPDCVIFLDLPPEISEKLRENRINKFTGDAQKDIHESNREYMIMSYENSLEVAKKFNWKIVKCYENGNVKTIENIKSEIYEIVRQYV